MNETRVTVGHDDLPSSYIQLFGGGHRTHKLSVLFEQSNEWKGPILEVAGRVPPMGALLQQAGTEITKICNQMAEKIHQHFISSGAGHTRPYTSNCHMLIPTFRNEPLEQGVQLITANLIGLKRYCIRNKSGTTFPVK